MAYSCAIEKYSLSIFIAKITQSHIIFSDFDNNEKDEQFMITFIIETFFCVINFIAYKWTCQIFTMICGVSSSRRQEIFKRRQKTAAMPSQENDERRQKEAAAAAAMFTLIWRLQADADSFFHACLYDHKVSHL